MSLEGPLTLVAELTYACPLRCAYCSNPLDWQSVLASLSTEDWSRVLREAAALGVVQLHLSGGEPLLRADLEELVGEARSLDLFVNLITSGVPATRERLCALRDAGLDAIQLSVQDARGVVGARIAGVDRHRQKLAVAAWTRELDLPLTLNCVLHRDNIDQVGELIALAQELGAHRLELANAQYLGWAHVNRAALLPSAAQIAEARAVVRAAQCDLEVLFVLPDLHADRPRACMGGWAKSYLIVAPDGMVLPCHAARDLPLEFWNARAQPLAAIWASSPGFLAFRGEAWMREPCRSCDERRRDFGGCRCQAFALTGDMHATDPACALAPAHRLVTLARSSQRARALRLR